MTERTERELKDSTRQLAHRELDEILDMYQQGADLWIVSNVRWTETGGDSAQLYMRIMEDY